VTPHRVWGQTLAYRAGGVSAHGLHAGRVIPGWRGYSAAVKLSLLFRDMIAVFVQLKMRKAVGEAAGRFVPPNRVGT
jgi:hypothetical protein